MNAIGKWEFEIDAYRQTARERLAVIEHKRMLRLVQGWAVARKAADLLRERFDVQRVAVFGSLAHPELFHIRSDVDLAVWGLDPRDFLRALAAVTGLDPEICVDLIAFEEAPESLRDLIKAEGASL